MSLIDKRISRILNIFKEPIKRETLNDDSASEILPEADMVIDEFEHDEYGWVVFSVVTNFADHIKFVIESSLADDETWDTVEADQRKTLQLDEEMYLNTTLVPLDQVGPISNRIFNSNTVFRTEVASRRVLTSHRIPLLGKKTRIRVINLSETQTIWHYGLTRTLYK